MISKEELHFKFLDYVIKNHKKVSDPVKVLQGLGLDERMYHAYDIAEALQREGYLKTISLHKGKIAIVDYTIDAKYFVEKIQLSNDAIPERQIIKNDLTVINQIIIGDNNNQIINKTK